MDKKTVSLVTKKHNTFSHNFLPRIQIERQDCPTGRVYVTPEGNVYPSVTSVLGHEPSPWLDQWKARVGEEEARKVSARAAARGTEIHRLSEHYLLNNPLSPDMFDREMWDSFKPLLNRVNNIRLLEGKMYSDILRMSGTTDCLGDFDSIPSIIDFKTSKRHKLKSDITSYFLQSTAYAMMALELYNIRVKQIVILIAVDDDTPQIFIEDPRNYVEELFAIRKRYDIFIKNQ